MKKLVYNPQTGKMEEVDLTPEELAQMEIDKNTEPLPPKFPLEYLLAEQDRQIQELKVKLIVSEQMVADSHQSQQELLEMLIDMGVM
ncbi:hypothetical protein [Psychrobacillus sp. FSL K6-1267]|uniref:hypothetical protein n=1 Tax=Psychrobacillus sp. FSL K6-1267 TaxID=2921543 RepID=UPI0030F8C33E